MPWNKRAFTHVSALYKVHLTHIRFIEQIGHIKESATTKYFSVNCSSGLSYFFSIHATPPPPPSVYYKYIKYNVNKHNKN